MARGNPVGIRPAVSGDATVLSDIAFRSKAYWGYDADFMARCRNELTVTAADIEAKPVFVAERERGRPVGFYALDLSDGVADVALLFVDPPVIGTGVGGALWRHLETTARDLGCRIISVEADPYAEEYYLAMGCERIGESPSVSIEGRSLPLLRRHVPA